MFSWTIMNSGIEATSKLAPSAIERADDGGIGVGLDGKVRLHARQVAFELAVVFPERVVIDHEQRRAVLFRQFLQPSLRDHGRKEEWVRSKAHSAAFSL
jgi:hypothetical protein